VRLDLFLPRPLTRAVSRLVNGRARDGEPGASKAARLRDSAVVDCAVYVDGVRQPGRPYYTDAFAEARRRPRAFVWLGLHEPDPAELAGVMRAFHLPELAHHDITSPAHRPTVEQFDDVTLLSLRTARYVEHTELTEWSEVVDTGHIAMFIGPRFVVTVRYGEAGPLSSVRTDLERRRALLAQGSWAVAYAITDRMINGYRDVANALEQDLHDIEETVFARTRSRLIAHVYQLKRELLEFKRAVMPLQRPMQALVANGVVPAPLRKHLRDVATHLTRVVEHVAAYDELVNSILQARLAQLSVQQNDDMRKIASWAAIAAAQTTIAGIYGMNFRVLPGADQPWGFAAMLVLMAVVGLLLHRQFRRAGWL